MNNIVDWGNNVNFIFIRDQNSATPYQQYVDWGNNINFIFIHTWSQTRRNVRVAANMFVWQLFGKAQTRLCQALAGLLPGTVVQNLGLRSKVGLVPYLGGKPQIWIYSRIDIHSSVTIFPTAISISRYGVPVIRYTHF